jgi:uncharacterized protein (TIGR03000 family)
MPMPPPPKGEQLKTPPKPAKEVMVPAPATIVVSLPAEAKLMIDDHITQSTSTTRVFASPNLEAGREFYYTIRGELTLDGQTVTTSKRVAVHAGEETRIQLEFPAASVAQR